jgi:serine/threonine protein phosphatase PrpC
MSKLLVGSATDVGLVRSNNQDQMLVAPGLYAVADGMGGHAAGEVASATAIRALEAAFEAGGDHSVVGLESAAKAANRAVWEQARANRGMFGMGTTLVALAVVERHDGTSGLAAAHIGDSRLYLFRQGKLAQLTVDHTLVQELVDEGQISPDQAAVHPQRHVLTRALGVEPVADFDMIELKPEHGDRYLLCSDGLPREASDTQIAEILARRADPTETAKQLVALAKSKGGSDNITVVVVDVLANDESPDTLIVVPGPASSAAGPPAQEESRADVPAVASGDGPARASPERGLGRAYLAPGKPKVLTWRVVGFLTAVCAVLAAAVGALAWYARSAYFVTISHGQITVYQGRPGGVLWFAPTVAQRTPYTASSVLASALVNLQGGQLEPSVAQADLFIKRLVSEKIEAEQPLPVNARGAPRSTARPSTSLTRRPKATGTAVPKGASAEARSKRATSAPRAATTS